MIKYNQTEGVLGMTFGEALRQLQAIYNIKLGNLSDALGYDISYMSKWISGAKLPSAKSAEMTCDRIAAYIAQQNSEENQSLAISKLGIAASSASFENALSDRLYTLYLEQKNQPKQPGNPDYNAMLISEPSSISEEIVKEVIYLYRKRKNSRMEGILAMPPDFLMSDSIVTANRVCALENSGNSIRIRQIISCADFGGNADMYLKYILKHLSLGAPIEMDFYQTPEERGHITPTLIIENGILIQGICDAITGDHSFSLITSDPAVVNDYYRVSDMYVQSLMPLTESINREGILSSNLTYSYSMQQQSRYLMRFMQPMHLQQELLDEYLDKYLTDKSMYDYQRKMHEIAYSSFNSALTYKSVLVDYMNSGRIRLFDDIVTLSREDRKRHLTHLVEALEDGKHISVGILNDRNPLLDLADISLSVFSNDNVSFAMDENRAHIDRILNFISPTLCGYLNEFFEHLAALPEAYIKREKRAIDYIYNGLKLI